MKVIVIGSGGRESAIIKKISLNPKVSKIYAIPGNAGISKLATCVNIKATDTEEVSKFALNEKIDFAIVTPDDPLVLGMVDKLEEVGIKCFGPTKNAAIIEGSKIFAKNLMKKYNIPTANYETFSDIELALKYLDKVDFPIVIKADGLALGKGVIIAENKEDAKNSIYKIMKDKAFGDSGNSIVIEEFLTGPEVSVLSFTDGKTIIPMISSMDHKKALDGDKGLNTGGMGTIAPNPYYTKEIEEICMNNIFIPTIEAMQKEGRKFKGCLYFGLMLTKNGPKVIEYNCRFGDPETQVVLPLLETDLLDIMINVCNETLDKIKVEFSKKASCCVVMASKGYPEKYNTGYEINYPENLDSEIYFAGVKEENNKLVTSGGRVLGVTAIANNLEDAIKNAYKDVLKIDFKDSYYRLDIGKKALNMEDKYG
ncbi:MAG: phosphoribosylamine--glycine ligase, partial [Eubacteriales bacterium]|nr:phosphoribosylamine--glycine ligase [Eubacteriales bacterium]